MLQRAAAIASSRFDMSYPRRVLTLLLLVFVMDYGDRALIGGMGPTLKHTFSLSNTELGLLAAVVNIVGAVATIPMGMIADRSRRTWLLALSLILWTVAMVLVGASLTFAMLLGARLLLGVVTAAAGPTTPSLVGDLVPASDRARALGFVSSGQLVGTGLGYIIAAFVTAILSWRWGFWLLAVFGVLVAAGFVVVGEPRRVRAAGRAEAARDAVDTDRRQRDRMQDIVRERGVEPSQSALLREDPTRMTIWEAALYVFRVRTDVIVLVGRSIGDYFFAGVSTYAVVFASKQFGISAQLTDLAILALGVGAVAGVLVVGRLADMLLRRGRLNSRLWLAATGYVVAPCALAPAFLTHRLAIALPLITIGAFFLAGAGPPLDAIRVDVLVPRLRGRGEAVREVVRTFAEGGAPLLFGILSGALASGTRGLQLAFLVTLPALIVTGLVLLIALRTYAHDVAAALTSTDRHRQRT